ncbi:uncharacterized protein LOC143219730 [Lasioglossum baleicum]|uniref:uncharacterized protein LOC143219730 n=1 Tax=Lasioglossum baleicum TaxID=434251 RepID=UPI003FCC5A85
MTVELLKINGTMVPHTVVPIIGDGACLFRAISYILYDIQVMAREVREEIVSHVVANWDEFAIMSHDSNGNNYSSAVEYCIDMSRPFTYGGLCELKAAGQLFPWVFEVYRNGELYVCFGTVGNHVGRLRFSHDLSRGHFDVYVNEVTTMSPPPSESYCDSSLYLTVSTKCPKKRRARCTDAIRKKQRQNAYRNYAKKHPEVNRKAVATYQQAHPEVHRKSQSRYEQNRVESKERSWKIKDHSGMAYDIDTNYEKDSTVALGSMTNKCRWCNALKWKEEAPGMCCSAGKVQLPPYEELPEPLYSLIMNIHPEHDHFMNVIRKYNSCFQMTSFGAKQIIKDGFMPTFKVQGQVYHLVGSLLPAPQNEPQYLQIYFVGEDDREVQLRCSNVPYVKHDLVRQLQGMLHTFNAYVRDLKVALNKVPATSKTFKVAINAERKPPDSHRGRFNVPTSNEVALVMVGQQFEKRDIILESHDNSLKRISEIHRSYDALQYPLLFCRGEDGYSISLPQRDPQTNQTLKKTVSAASFYSFRIMIREGEDNHLVYFRSLFSQFLVDMYAKIETERLMYIRKNQAQLRADSYIHLRDAIERQDVDVEQLGQKVVLPSSFTGGPRYMHERTQDAMTYVRQYGRPDLFITFTCNPRWKDITDMLLPGQKSHDRHDIIARVFHLKVKKMMVLLTKGNLFGAMQCFIYSVEWQKRGLPHIHILLWLQQRITPDKIDNVIRAEIPDPEQDPLLYDIVKSNMIHGPCGSLNHKSPCMKDGRCSKRYPRPLLKDTQTGDDGYPQYRRRSPADGGYTIKNKEIELDSRWVVPYNPVLLRTFNAHINVEYCNSVKAIKYICKYVNKGSDQAAFTIENEKDEVKIYESGRYISSSEAVWRILSFPIHERFPPVVHLAVHLENGQRVYFNPRNLSDKINSPPQTTLLAFFEICKTDNYARTLLYSEISSYFVWNNKKFSRRKRGIVVEGWPGVKKEHVLGRVYTIHPNNTECYHLRLLLHEVRGPTSFEYLKTVNGILHPTFQSACKAIGLLEDDKHWDTTLEEAALCDSPLKLRELFTIMLVFCQLSDPLSLWEKYKESLSEDIKRQLERELQDNAQLLIDEVYNRCLMLIEDAVLTQAGQNLTHYGLPQPKRSAATFGNLEYLREINYDPGVLREVVSSNEELLTDEQLYIYQEILSNIEKGIGKIFFLDAPGGTGKTFLINLLLAKVRSNRGIAIAVASSGIAATLLEGGKTAHAAFKLPLNIIYVETPLCNISKQSNAAQVLRDCKLIVWDESTMAHKGGFEALNRTLKDIRGNDDMMGGVTVLLAGDFRQTLPIVPRGTRADEVKACIKASNLWSLIKKLHLKKNMRVHLKGDVFAGEFSNLLLKIGNGEYPETEGKIQIPPNLASVVSTVDDLIARIYPDVHNLHSKSTEWLEERAILTPKNDQASVINDTLLKSFAGAEHQYKSVDTVMHTDNAIHYPVEFLNTLNPPGLPSHELILKVGAPVMLLRNLNPPKLCNGTRLRVKALHKNVVEAIVFTGCARGESVYIPRIPLIPSEYPFEFKRLQFPLKVCFAMTINKSQGQSLKTAGIDLRKDCFSHGQFYVACSRVSSPSSLVVLAYEGKTSNVVYKEVL